MTITRLSNCCAAQATRATNFTKMKFYLRRSKCALVTGNYASITNLLSLFASFGAFAVVYLHLCCYCHTSVRQQIAPCSATSWLSWLSWFTRSTCITSLRDHYHFSLIGHVPFWRQAASPQSIFFVAEFMSLVQQSKFSVHVDVIVQPANDVILLYKIGHENKTNVQTCTMRQEQACSGRN